MIFKKITNTNFIVLFCLLFLLFLIFYDLIINNHSYLQHQIYDSFRNYEANKNYNTGLNLFNNIENYLTFFTKIPILYFYSIFNPFLEKLSQTKYLILILENLLIVITIIITIYKPDTKNIKILFLTFIPFLIFFMNLYMFVSYSNIGTGFRYSVLAKILIIILLYVLNRKRVEKLFNFFFKHIIKY